MQQLLQYMEKPKIEQGIFCFTEMLNANGRLITSLPRVEHPAYLGGVVSSAQLPRLINSYFLSKKYDNIYVKYI